MGISFLRDFFSGFHPGLWGLHPFGIYVRISSGVMWMSSLRDLCPDFIRGYMDIIPSGFVVGFHPGLWGFYPFGIWISFLWICSFWFGWRACRLLWFVGGRCLLWGMRCWCGCVGSIPGFLVAVLFLFCRGEGCLRYWRILYWYRWFLGFQLLRLILRKMG